MADHYGAAFAYRFGGVDDPGVAKVMEHYQCGPDAIRGRCSRSVTPR